MIGANGAVPPHPRWPIPIVILSKNNHFLTIAHHRPSTIESLATALVSSLINNNMQ